MEDRLRVGVITQSHGIKGEVKVFPTTDDNERFKSLKKCYLTDGKETIWAYGTPWAGKEGWQKNRKAQLNGICFLKQAEENRIRRVNPQELLSRMICQIYFPDNPETAGKTMELMDRLLTDIPLYLLECDMSKEAVRCSFEMLTGKQMPKNVSDNTHYEEKEEKG